MLHSAYIFLGLTGGADTLALAAASLVAPGVDSAVVDEHAVAANHVAHGRATDGARIGNDAEKVVVSQVPAPQHIRGGCSIVLWGDITVKWKTPPV